MTEHTALSDAAVAWVETLLARGVTLQLGGKRVIYHPKSAYNAMSNAERATLKEHKAVIVEVLRDRYAGNARTTVAETAEQATPEPDLHPVEAQQRAGEFVRNRCCASSDVAFHGVIEMTREELAAAVARMRHALNQRVTVRSAPPRSSAER